MAQTKTPVIPIDLFNRLSSIADMIGKPLDNYLEELVEDLEDGLALEHIIQREGNASRPFSEFAEEIGVDLDGSLKA